MYSIVMDDPEITTILYYCFYMIPYFPMVIFWVRILPLSKTEPGPGSDLLLFTLNLLYRYYHLELWTIKRERKSWFDRFFLYLGVKNKTGTDPTGKKSDPNLWNKRIRAFSTSSFWCGSEPDTRIRGPASNLI